MGVGIAGLILWIGVHWFKIKLRSSIGDFAYYRQLVKPLIAFVLAWGGSEFVIKEFIGEIKSIPLLVALSLVVCFLYFLALVCLDWKHLWSVFNSYMSNKSDARNI